MSTLAVVEEVLRETAVPMSVREIVERAGARLPSKSKTPDTVVARDLSMDIKKKGEGSLFTRTSPGRYTLRALAGAGSVVSLATGTLANASANGAELAAIATSGTVAPRSPGVPASATPAGQPAAASSQLGVRKPAVAAPSAGTTGVAATARARDAEGGGYVG